MRKAIKKAITAWVRDVAVYGEYKSPDANGKMYFGHDCIDYAGGRFATSFRFNNGLRFNTYVVVALPGPGTHQLTKFLMNELTRRKVQHLIMPLQTRRAAAILSESIHVVENGKPGFLLGPSALFTGKVQEPVYHDRWRGELKSRFRESFYISGFDSQDGGYFLCELPQGVSPRTLAEAFECLKPEAVVLAEQMGRKVRRQGDIFCIPLAKDFAGEERIKKGKRDYVLKTNHLAPEMVQYGNAVYARGKLLHRPRNRRPDHAPLFLGRKWHLLVKNTVPVVINRW